MTPRSPTRFHLLAKRDGGPVGEPAVLFAIALAARIVYLLMFRPPLESQYLALADGLVRERLLGVDGMPSTAFEPLYPALLAAGRLLFGDRNLLIQILQAGIAASGAVLSYHLALRLTASRRTATAAGTMFALHPLLIRQAAAATDLGLASSLIVAFAVAFVAIRDVRDAITAGVWLGLTVLTRSMTLPALLPAAGILLARRQPREAIVLALTTASLVAPMVIRSYVLGGSPWPTRSGINLYIGNSPYTSRLLPTYDLDLLEPVAYDRFIRARPGMASDDPRSAVEFDAFLTRQAIAFMAQHPWTTLRQKALNVWYVLSPRLAPYKVSGPHTRVRIQDDMVGVEAAVPRSVGEVAAHALTTVVLLVGGAAGVYLRRHELLGKDAILWAIFAAFLIVNVMYVPATRYTAPAQFVLIFYSAVAFARLREGSPNAAVA